MAKVFERRTMSRDDLARSGLVCAWRGCQEVAESSPAPAGWVSLLTFPGAGEVTRDSVRIKLAKLDWDCVLCPAHVLALDLVLKDRGKQVDVPPAGRA
jgi:hypothetical protein